MKDTSKEPVRLARACRGCDSAKMAFFTAEQVECIAATMNAA